MKLSRLKPVRKAAAAFTGAGGLALASALPSGVTAEEGWTIAAAAVGACVLTWWVPANVPRYSDTPQDRP